MEEENNKNIQKNVLKINFKLFIIIAVVVAIVAVTVVGLVIRNKRNKKIEELEAERKRVAEILKNSSSKTEKSENVEFSNYVAETNFTQKTFDEKYTDLYNIIKGSSKEIKSVTYSYKNISIKDILDKAEDITNLSVEEKLNLISNCLNLEFKDISKTEIKNTIKKYYGIDEKNEFPDELELMQNDNIIIKYKLNEDIYEAQYSYRTVNLTSTNGNRTDTTSFVLGILDNVEDKGNKIILTEKTLSVKYNNGYSIYSNNNELICKLTNDNKFDIAKYYDDLDTIEYTFDKNNGNYGLTKIVKHYSYEDSYIYKHIKEGLEIKTLLPEGEIAKIETIEEKDDKYVINAKVHDTIKLSDDEADKLYEVVRKYRLGIDIDGEYLVTSNNEPYKCKATGINGEEEYSVYLEKYSTAFIVWLVSDKEEKFYLDYFCNNVGINEAEKRLITIEVDKNIKRIDYDYKNEYFSKYDLSSLDKGSNINAVINENNQILEINATSIIKLP